MTAMADSSDRPSSKDVDDASADVQSKEEVSLETGTGGEEVWWEEPADQDPENPMNWPASRKWATIAVLSSITFVTPLASSMFAPGIPEVLREFQTTSQSLATFVVAVYVLGFAVGPLIIAPLSEIYGRVPIYNVTNVMFVVFTILCAISNSMTMLIVMRFFAGAFGVAVITCGSGTIADIMPREQRGLAMSVWSIGPLLGPVIGPVAGGFLIEYRGWRWVFWVIAIVAGVFTITAFLVLRESYPPVVLERKASRLRKSTGNKALRSKLSTGLSQKDLFLRSIVRPTKMLLYSPIVSMMCVYIAVIYGILYILFTTFTFVYEGTYGFTARSAGLTFIASGVGMLLGLAFVGTYSDMKIRKVMASEKEVQPEDRLPTLVVLPASLLIPAGLILYGWSAEKAAFWIVPMIGTSLIGFGMICLMMSIQTYLIDAFTIHAASVTAANAVLRSILGALLPLCGLQVYDRLGLGWGNTMMGLIVLALAPVPLVFRVYGQRIRENPRWQVSF